MSEQEKIYYDAHEAAVERIKLLEAALSEMTHDRDLWASDHEEDCPNLTLLDLSRDENTELKAQVAQLQATICTLAQALKKFAQSHHTWCPSISVWPRGSKACICGKIEIAAALAALNEARP